MEGQRDPNKTPSPQPDMDRNRLPTLFECLSRRTLPPVDLFSFYIYMRDQQRSVDYLDFWLDVAQHMSLCRHYVRELRRSVMIGTPDHDKSGSKRSSMLLESLGDMHHPAAGPSMFSSEKDKHTDAQMSAFLREEAANRQNGNGRTIGHSPHGSVGTTESRARRTESHERARPSFAMSSPHEITTTDSNSPAHTVARNDLRASAEKILYTFLLPGAEREIILPHGVTQEVIRAIEEDGRDDPELFDQAKDYVFQAMERDAFPGFLRMKALGNLVPTSMMMRLGIGLLAIFGGLWTAFILIFLNKSRATRCWIILPFTIGVYALTTQQYALDPVLALLNYSEYTFMSFTKFGEPYVTRLLHKRALTTIAVWIAVTVCLCVLFIFVPGKRL